MRLFCDACVSYLGARNKWIMEGEVSSAEEVCGYALRVHEEP